MKTKADLQLRHAELHAALDELLACYIGQRRHPVLELPLGEFLSWSHQQLSDPQCDPMHGLKMEWLPSTQNINALPEPIRKFIHHLETNADPAGTIRELAYAQQRIRELEVKITELLQERQS